jgi:hypothetical protein
MKFMELHLSAQMLVGRSLMVVGVVPNKVTIVPVASWSKPLCLKVILYLLSKLAVYKQSLF